MSLLTGTLVVVILSTSELTLDPIQPALEPSEDFFTTLDAIEQQRLRLFTEPGKMLDVGVLGAPCRSAENESAPKEQ